MSYLALYRKYRPNNFKDLVGQSEVASVIKNEILNNKVSHAYLFSGPRGTGKTSTAKIIARMINCSSLSEEGIPCGICDSCLNFHSSSDIVEIDAASNNGVDEIRDLRDKVNLVPTHGKYKIYIIDEVHMLTTQAFNALLKTLEEPPAHVIFILATTEFYKIPVTVVSRCQKFQFLKFSNEDIVDRLSKIALEEGILAENEVLFEIARLSDGGMRDAINMLDQLSSFKNVSLTVDDVYKLNGVISYTGFRNLLHDIYDNKVVSIVEFIDSLDKSGKNIDRFIGDFITFLKDVLIYKNTSVFSSTINEKNEALKDISNIYLLDELYNLIIKLNDLSIRIKSSSFGKILLITELINLSNSFSNVVVKEVKKSIITKDEVVNTSSEEENKEAKVKVDAIQKTMVTDKSKKIRINNAFATASKKNKEFLLENWSKLQEKLSNDTNFVSIAGMMQDVEVLVVGDKDIIFLAKYNSLLDRLFEQIIDIETLLLSSFGIEYKAVFLLEDEWKYEKEQYINNLKNGVKYSYIEDNSSVNNDSEVDDDVNKIISIFGNNIITYN